MALDPFMPVLVVDDHGATIQIIRALLRQVGFVDIDDAESGAEALTKMCLKRYELVISEWQLKLMTGNDLLREGRCDQGLRRIPFIVIGASLPDKTSRRQWLRAKRIGHPLMTWAPTTTRRPKAPHGVSKTFQVQFQRVATLQLRRGRLRRAGGSGVRHADVA
jgi:CheY-like chemotaxis protein